MHKVIIFLCLIVVLIAQINNTAYAQTAFPSPTGYPTNPDPYPTPDPTSSPGGSGPIEGGVSCAGSYPQCNGSCPKVKPYCIKLGSDCTCSSSK